MSEENGENTSPAEYRTAAEHSFDTLARSLASNTLSRQQALRLIGGAIAGFVFSSVPKLARAQVDAQAEDTTAAVVDSDSTTPPDGDSAALLVEDECPPDAAWCGGGGLCCSPSELCCPARPVDRCVDPQWDPENCGDCGIVCSEGQFCQNGRCECWGSCNPPLVLNPVTCQCESPDITPPTITINMPPPPPPIIICGAAPSPSCFAHGEFVPADFSCEDEVGGSGLRTCDGTVPNGFGIDTMCCSPRDCNKMFTVTATDNAGNQASRTHFYRVMRSPTWPNC